MSRYSSSENPFLEIGFRSASSKGTLQTIQLIGVPGEQLANSEYAVSEKVRLFFDDLIVRTLFRKSRSTPDCDFHTLKIWLYDTETPNRERGYEIPEIDQKIYVFPRKILHQNLKKFIFLIMSYKEKNIEDGKKFVKNYLEIYFLILLSLLSHQIS